MLVNYGVFVVFALKCLRLRKKSAVDDLVALRARSNFRNSASTRTNLKFLSELEQIIELGKSISKRTTIEKPHTINFVCGDMEYLEREMDVYYHLV